MSDKPDYVVHEVDEKEVTVDWFFGNGPGKARQTILVLVGWFFVVLPVYITLSALVNRNNDDAGWWSYHEGFVMWEVTMLFLGILTCLFIVGFLVLHRINRIAGRRRAQRTAYDEHRLAQRMEITADWYANKFGPHDLRVQQKSVRIEPYGDVETYELRGLYREYGVD